MEAARRWMRLTAGGLTVMLLFVGCGDDESAGPAQTTVPPTTSTTLSQIQLDEQKAERIVLTATDLPGFTADPRDADDEDSPEAEAELAACANNDPVFAQMGEESDPRGAFSPEFKKGETVTVSSAVTFADSEDQAQGAITAFSAPSFPACFSRGFAAELRRDGTFTNVTVNTTKLPAMTVGDQSVGLRSVARLRAGGTAITVYADFIRIRSGRALSGIQIFSAPTPFPDAERIRLATAIAGRMAAP